MSFQARSTATMMAALAIAYIWYAVTIYRQAADVTATDIRYQPLVFAVVLPLIVLATIGHIAISAVKPGEAGTTDERDREIARRGALVGGSIVSVTALGALVAAMAEVDHFWIAHLLLLGLVVAELADGSRRLFLYRRGV